MANFNVFQTLRTFLPYWRVATPGEMSVEGKSAPCMSEKIGPDGDENYVYYSPSAEYPGHVKVKLHLLYYNVRMKTDAFYLMVAICIR